MRIFFDTNILLDIALRREPFLANSQAILADAIENHSCFLSWHSISNLSYILGKIESKKSALTFIEQITKVCHIAPVEHRDLAIAFQYNNGDLEDAMQIASALAVSAETIVTRDPKGFTLSPVPITNPHH